MATSQHWYKLKVHLPGVKLGLHLVDDRDHEWCDQAEDKDVDLVLELFNQVWEDGNFLNLKTR
jgi:hypothetical protein